jgi:SAM-dependent methyltransferase
MDGVFRESAALLHPAGGDGEAGRLLDVGCGFGSFVGLMRGRGWDAEGVDPSPAAVAAAREAGLPVRLGTLEDLDAPDGAYDAVTLFYVLEHLPEPMKALKKINGLLKPGGTLLLRVPHTTPIVRLLSPFGAGAALYDPPFHLYDFSPRVLARMLAEAGFAGVRTFPGRPTVPSRPGLRFVSLLSGAAAAGLYRLSRGTLLLPGVSKTTIAGKPA